MWVCVRDGMFVGLCDWISGQSLCLQFLGSLCFFEFLSVCLSVCLCLSCIHVILVWPLCLVCASRVEPSRLALGPCSCTPAWHLVLGPGSPSTRCTLLTGRPTPLCIILYLGYSNATRIPPDPFSDISEIGKLCILRI